MKNKKITKNNRKSKKSRKFNKTKKYNKKNYRGGEQSFKKIRVENVPYSYSIDSLVDGNIINTTYYGKYSGEWVDEKPFKEGKFVADDTENFYEGSWEDGKPNGFGEIVIPHSKMYSGEFLNGKIHGTGIMEFFNTGVILEGYFEDCMINNRQRVCINGVANYPDGSKFIGQFVNNEKIGGKAEPEGENLANNNDYNMELGNLGDIEGNTTLTSVTDLPFF
jgi:hypothetical protein